MSDIVLIDIEDALKRVVNNNKLYVKLLTKFKEDTNLKKMEDALAAGDLENAKTAAHTLKGLAANLSLVELHKQCAEMDSQIKDELSNSGKINPAKINEVKNAYSFTMDEIDKVIAQYGQ